MSIDKHISELDKQGQKANLLRALLVRFPDLERQTDRWGHEKFCSGSANHLVDKVHIHHNCGCCEDSPIEVEPYITIDGINIYGKPYKVVVGEKNKYGYGEVPYEDWQNRLTETGYPSIIVSLVERHFEENSAVDVEDY